MRDHTYKTGDRVRLKGFMEDSGVNGQKGKLRSPGLAWFDWIVNLDVNGQPMGIYETNIEPLRWWKFWRSRKG